MKKLLLFASVIALMTSCAKTNITGDAPQAPAAAKGIYFAPSVVDDAPASKAEFEQPKNAEAFNTNWFSDKDRIGVIFERKTADVFIDAHDVATPSLVTAVSTWFAKKGEVTADPAVFKSSPYEFKASLSGVAGYFVAANDADVLDVKNNTAADDKGTKRTTKIRAFWPLTDKVQDLKGGTATTKITLPDLSDQKQTTVDGLGIVEKAFMVAETEFTTTGYSTTDNSLTAKRVILPFKRINPVIWFKITTDEPTVKGDLSTNTEYVRDYALPNRFGNLKKLTLTSDGAVKKDGTLDDTRKSKLTFGNNATFNIAYTPEQVADGSVFVPGTTGITDKITNELNVNAGLAWNNNATVFMSVANVNRAALRGDGLEERMSTAVDFDKLHFDFKVETDNDWTVKEFTPGSTKPKEKAYNWIQHPAANLADAPYLVYEYVTGGKSVIPTTANEYVLQINPSFKRAADYVGDKAMTVADIFKAGVVQFFTKNGTTAENGKIKFDDITHIVANVELSNEELAFVNKNLTALEYVTLLQNTKKLDANVFSKLTEVKYLNMPKVTEVAADAFAKTATGFTDVYMGSYNFNAMTDASVAISKQLLLPTTAALVRADISAVPTIQMDFTKTGLDFSNLLTLKEIRVKDGVELGPNAFLGCKLLNTVQFPVVINSEGKPTTPGAVNLMGANVFDGCEALKSINISNKVIPNFSFNACTLLTKVLDAAGEPIVPTAIGENAFAGCAITDMNLSQAATIGVNAFNGCTALTGSSKVPSGLSNANVYLAVDKITVLNNGVFDGCTALEFVSFKNATTIGLDCFKGTSKLTEIRFFKKITGVNGKTELTSNLFGSAANAGIATSNVKFFYGVGQEFVSNNTLSLTGNVKDSKEVKTTFRAIQPAE